jgi:ParB family chromosome partitioning protein
MDEHATMTGETTGIPDDKGTMRRRLGRGLNALLGGSVPEGQANEPAADAEAVQGPTDEISVELIERNPFQPRKEFDKDSLLELAESLMTHGMLQPLLVRPNNGGYQLIAGERRWLAAKEAGMETVPCRVLELEDKNVCEVALVENLQRKDLSDLEKAKAFQDYLDRFGGTANDLAKQLGMNRSTVANFIRLLALPEPVKKALNAGRISNGHARALLSLEERDQIELCKLIQRDSLSVRKTEDAVKKLLGREEAGPDTIPFEQKPEENKPADQAAKSNHIVSLEGQLRECLGTKVEIKVTGKDTGKITVEFNNNAEFERLVKALRTAGPSLTIADAA